MTAVLAVVVVVFAVLAVAMVAAVGDGVFAQARSAAALCRSGRVVRPAGVVAPPTIPAGTNEVTS